MKQLFFLLLLLVTGSLAATAQGPLLIFNNTDCEITMSLRSHGVGEGCAVNQSESYDMPGGSSLLVNSASEWPEGWQGMAEPPSGAQTWDELKFYIHGGGCTSGTGIGNAACGWPSTWSSGSCKCEGQTVYAAWAGGGGFTTVIFHY